MHTIVYDPNGEEIARVNGKLSLSEFPLDDTTGYRVEHVATADDVRAEASRRLQALFQARDAAHLEIVLLNASREAIRLLRKGSETWTSAEAARAAELEQYDLMIEGVRAASNVLEPDPPSDYAADSYWPNYTHNL